MPLPEHVEIRTEMCSQTHMQERRKPFKSVGAKLLYKPHLYCKKLISMGHLQKGWGQIAPPPSIPAPMICQHKKFVLTFSGNQTLVEICTIANTLSKYISLNCFLAISLMQCR